MTRHTQPNVSFGPFTLAPSRGALLKGSLPVPLGGRAYEILLALVEHRGRVVAKDELLQRVWPNQTVEDNNLTVTMSALRKALREGAGNQYIQTVSGRGYRFVAAVRASGAGPLPEAAVPGAGTPSIAVLPFTNLGGDPAQDHFGDGIAEDIISELSRNRWLTVIAGRGGGSGTRAHTVVAVLHLRIPVPRDGACGNRTNRAGHSRAVPGARPLTGLGYGFLARTDALVSPRRPPPHDMRLVPGRLAGAALRPSSA